MFLQTKAHLATVAQQPLTSEEVTALPRRMEAEFDPTEVHGNPRERGFSLSKKARLRRDRESGQSEDEEHEAAQAAEAEEEEEEAEEKPVKPKEGRRPARKVLRGLSRAEQLLIAMEGLLEERARVRAERAREVELLCCQIDLLYCSEPESQTRVAPPPPPPAPAPTTPHWSTEIGLCLSEEKIQNRIRQDFQAVRFLQ